MKHATYPQIVRITLDKSSKYYDRVTCEKRGTKQDQAENWNNYIVCSLKYIIMNGIHMVACEQAHSFGQGIEGKGEGVSTEN